MRISDSAQLWLSVCSLFAKRTPVFWLDMPMEQRALLSTIGSGLWRGTASDLRSTLCPFCRLYQGPVEAISADPLRLACRCPDCGLIDLERDHATQITIDPLWLARQLRSAMGIASHDQPQLLQAGIWRLGTARQSTVLLARDLQTLIEQPDLIDRCRTKAHNAIDVIAPAKDAGNAVAEQLGLHWLRLEERFSWYGQRVCFDVPGEAPEAVQGAAHDQTSQQVFSEDFAAVYLPGWPHGPIALSRAQAAVFRVLAEATQTLSGEAVMRRAQLASEKPSDVFKVKTKNKGATAFEGPLLAFKTLVRFDGRGYSLQLPQTPPVR